MDQNEVGFEAQKEMFYITQEKYYRTQIVASGIRILGSSQGVIWEWSLMSIIVQIAGAIGLLLFAKILTDKVMLYFFREKNHYRNMKFIQTEVL